MTRTNKKSRKPGLRSLTGDPPLLLLLRRLLWWVGIIGGWGVWAVFPPAVYAGNETTIGSSDVPPDHLSVDQAVQFGLTHHPKLFWFQHGVKKEGARVKVSKSHFYPHVGAGALYGESNPGLGNQSFNNMNFFTPIYPMDYAKMGNISAPNEPLGVATLGVNQLLLDLESSSIGSSSAWRGNTRPNSGFTARTPGSFFRSRRRIIMSSWTGNL